jgi:hypothetical protein
VATGVSLSLSDLRRTSPGTYLPDLRLRHRLPTARPPPAPTQWRQHPTRLYGLPSIAVTPYTLWLWGKDCAMAAAALSTTLNARHPCWHAYLRGLQRAMSDVVDSHHQHRLPGVESASLPGSSHTGSFGRLSLLSMPMLACCTAPTTPCAVLQAGAANIRACRC